MNRPELVQLLILQQEQMIVKYQMENSIRRRGRRRERRYWVRPWLNAERRLQFGHYDRLVSELKKDWKTHDVILQLQKNATGNV